MGALTQGFTLGYSHILPPGGTAAHPREERRRIRGRNGGASAGGTAAHLREERRRICVQPSWNYLEKVFWGCGLPEPALADLLPRTW